LTLASENDQGINRELEFSLNFESPMEEAQMNRIAQFFKGSIINKAV
jgi:hypothetical protein